jgi:hypothetical protein
MLQLTRSIRVAREQLERVDHGPVGGVVAAELQRRDQLRQPTPVVIGVRGAQHRPDALVKRVLGRFRFVDQITQGALGNDWEQRAADRLVRMLDGGLGEREQDALLAAHALEVIDKLLLDPALGVRVDLVNQADQQLEQRIGDLRGTHPAERREQRHPDRGRMRAHPRRILAGRARLPCLEQLLRRVAEQAVRQPDGLDPLELGDLPQQRVEPELPRI